MLRVARNCSCLLPRVRRSGPPLSLLKGGVVVSEAPVLVSWYGRTAVVRLPAEVDLTIADDVREALLSVLNQGARGLVVDMTATTFCDSAGITALVRACRRADANGATMRVAVSGPPVLRVFSLVGIDRLIDIHPTVDAARASLPDQEEDRPGPMTVA
jgi:anti-sigma B factor antagonist